MESDRFARVCLQEEGEPSCDLARVDGVAEMKLRQSRKIREIWKALRAAGFCALDEQARVLGLPRSTAWTLLQAKHKASGLSAATIDRMLASPSLPAPVRSQILEYVEEKAAGLYGGSR